VAQIPVQARYRQLLVPEALVAVGHRTVGHHEGGDGGGPQDCAADGLDAEELHHRVQDAGAGGRYVETASRAPVQEAD
jgi:hypothetical protein